MSSPLGSHPSPAAWGDSSSLLELEPRQFFQIGLALVVGAVFFLGLFPRSKKSDQFPLINPPNKFDWSNWEAKRRFAQSSTEMLEQGRTQYKDQLFRVMADSGEVIAIPSKFVNEVRNEKNLDFMESIAEDFHSRIPGFGAFAAGTQSDGLIQTVARKQLTKFLNKVTEPLSEETRLATELRFGTSSEWKTYTIYPEILDIVARISTRVFLGPEVCRNEEWLHITKNYTVDSFVAASNLLEYPYWMRSIVHWFQPECKVIREQQSKANSIITPVIEKRRRLRAEAAAKGEAVSVHNDAIDWLEDESNGKTYNAEMTQLSLSMAAIHTTTDLLTETLLRLARRPELMEKLREEISRVLRADGWKKTSLYNMKLLDSVIKECQRLRPNSIISMRRKALGDVTLSNGQTIPKGSRTVCLTDQCRSSKIFYNPEQFDPHRFEKQRGTETDNSAHLVSTGVSSLGFGHGQHACPGRFFAANEIKVALCHMIMKYDWKVPADAKPEPEALLHAFALSIDPASQVIVKRRPEVELDIDNI